MKVRQPVVVQKSMSNASTFKEAKITRKLSNLEQLAGDLDLDMEIKKYTDLADSKKVNAFLNNMKAKDSELAMVNKLIKQEETKNKYNFNSHILYNLLEEYHINDSKL